MPPAADWLTRALATGESVQDAPPRLGAERAAVLAALRRAFDRHELDVAGPPVAFDAEAALAAAEVLAVACWQQATGTPGPPLPSLPEPAGPGAHLSADVTLRLLVSVWRRAAGGPLGTELEAVLRAWPLSGVLADLGGVPATPSDFGAHSGLQLLYAERLALAPRPGWLPPPGPARGAVERVFARRRLPIPGPVTDPTPDA